MSASVRAFISRFDKAKESTPSNAESGDLSAAENLVIGNALRRRSPTSRASEVYLIPRANPSWDEIG